LEDFDVVVLGAGAAGMMCAIEAGKRGRSVLVIDHAKAPGEKIRISGGGRCNFTNVNTARRPTSCRPTRSSRLGPAPLPPERLHRPGREVRHRLPREDPGPAVLRRLGQADHRDAADRDGQGGRQAAAGDRDQGRGQDRGRLRVELLVRPGGCASLVVATGGKSIPKMGATGLGYEIAQQFGRPSSRPVPRWCP
jgi:glycine/D-amino acid oxidase-like deaminating enzyme